LGLEEEIRKFFLIRPSIESKTLLAHFKMTIKTTPNGGELFVYVSHFGLLCYFALLRFS
jgi:hypothetical protein